MSQRNYGWVVVGVGALITCVAIGAMLSLPVFLAPISADTGWSRAGIAFAITLNFLMMGVGSFGWGYLSDRYGARRVVLIHWDDFFRPLTKPLRALPYAGDDLDVSMRVLSALAADDGVALHLPTLWQRADPWS